ncbi:MAG: helix-turn-helix transcriptional regulator [Burkholderiaceae bacterium]|jgi:transcriptional regulator with XRE-family HTH domain|nr:helix-turn-helix transcriptional regulator [Burkholderiaceae bacterium]
MLRTKSRSSGTGPGKSAAKARETLPKRSAAKQKDSRDVAGVRLINRIRGRINELGLQERYIADMIGVTPIYWHSIANGHRKISSLGKEKLKKIAQFLNIPTVQAMSLAGMIDYDDFFLGPLEEQLEVSVVKMRNDPAWMYWAPGKEEWERLSPVTKIGMVMLYETVFYHSLLSRAEIENPRMKKEIQKFVRGNVNKSS